MTQRDTAHIMELIDLWLGYRPDNYLLKQVNAKIGQGEMIALVGRNGTGKSTLLRTIAGIQHAARGGVKLNGRSIETTHQRQLASWISFVGTGSSITENLTVFEMVSLGRHPYTNWWGALGVVDRQKINESLRFVGMEEFSGARIDRLSDGERQRVMIAMALAQDTKIIILDEPTAFLDIPNRIGIVEVLHKLKADGRSVIYSTHEFDNVFTYADKIWVIHNQRIIEGAPEDLGMDKVFEEIFRDADVAFDQENLRFVREINPGKKIFLDAEDQHVEYWTYRALERIGFRVVREYEENLLRVTARKEKGRYQWNIEEKHTTTAFKSLYALAGYLIIEN
ncbi:MAG: ABC transporter ATP-binding protein [Bacteroidales bacterium]